MAILISDSSNTSYDGKLSTANGWYRVEASNIGAYGNALGYSIPVTNYALPVTFANAGNCQGIMLSTSYSISTITAYLQESKTCTLTIANPGVVTITGHGLLADNAVSFNTTGAATSANQTDGSQKTQIVETIPTDTNRTNPITKVYKNASGQLVKVEKIIGATTYTKTTDVTDQVIIETIIYSQWS